MTSGLFCFGQNWLDSLARFLRNMYWSPSPPFGQESGRLACGTAISAGTLPRMYLWECDEAEKRLRDVMPLGDLQRCSRPLFAAQKHALLGDAMDIPQP
jgi:hypothetical protein